MRATLLALPNGTRDGEGWLAPDVKGKRMLTLHQGDVALIKTSSSGGHGSPTTDPGQTGDSPS